MTKTNNGKIFAIIAALLYAVGAVWSIIETIATLNDYPWYPTEGIVILVFSCLILAAFSIAMFLRNKIVLAVTAGIAIAFHIYLLARSSGDVSISSVFSLLVYISLIALAVMALNNVQAVKYLWFLPCALLLIGNLIVWIKYDYFEFFSYVWKTVTLGLIEIVALLFAGLWLKEEVSGSNAPKYYSPYQQNPYAPYQQNGYAPYQQNAYAPQPNAYAPYQQNAYAQQPNPYAQQQNPYAQQPRAYAPQPNAYAQQPQQNPYAQQRPAYPQQPVYPQQQRPAYPQQPSYPQQPAYAQQQRPAAAPNPQPAYTPPQRPAYAPNPAGYAQQGADTPGQASAPAAEQPEAPAPEQPVESAE